MGSLISVDLNRSSVEDETVFPYTLPVIRSFTSLSLGQPVTFLVGENGTGKSTLLEAIAVATELPVAGGEDLFTDPMLAPSRLLARSLRLSWRRKDRQGFFLRAEDFLNHIRTLAAMKTAAEEDLLDAEVKYGDRGIAASLAKLPASRALHDLKTRYGDGLDKRSHGEGFFDFFQARLSPGGLYLLDEPETPLSPLKQIALLSLMTQFASQNCQFVVATHSPILMAYPGAKIYSFDTTPVSPVRYDDLDHVRLTRDFLNHPEAFLRHFTQGSSE